MPFLSLTGVSRTIGEIAVVRDVNFIQNQFQHVAIAGETGSGKSSLLKIIAGLLQPDGGTVRWRDKPVLGPDERLVAGEPGIVDLSQHFELPKSLRVEQILQYASNVSDQQAARIFRICQIDHLLDRRTDALSGGEKQRIALAKVLVGSPDLLLLDEPYSNLDILHKNLLKGVVDDVARKLKITTILVSHDPVDLLAWADTIIVMRRGTMVQQASPSEIYQQPINEYVAGLFGKYSIVGPSLAVKLVKGASRSKNIIVRPESFRIAVSGTGVKGTITRILFSGSFNDVEVDVAETRITVRTTATHWKRGEEVRVRVVGKKFAII